MLNLFQHPPFLLRGEGLARLKASLLSPASHSGADQVRNDALNQYIAFITSEARTTWQPSLQAQRI